MKYSVAALIVVEFVAPTDANGRYEFADLPGGRYAPTAYTASGACRPETTSPLLFRCCRCRSEANGTRRSPNGSVPVRSALN
jgi:hypothetical protein